MTVDEILKLIGDEKARQQVAEAMKNEWMPKSDFTKAAQAKADELKAAQAEAAALKAENDRFMAWYNKDYAGYVAQVKPIVAEYYAAGKGNAGNGNPNPGQNQDPFSDWDSLTPQQQWAKFYELQQAALQNWGTQYSQALQKILADKEQYYQNYLDIYIEANERKRQDPTLEIPTYMKRQLALKSGQASSDDAYRLETYEKEKEKWLEEGRKHGRQEAETEYKAKKPESPHMPQPPQPFKPAAVSQSDRMAELRQKVAEKYPGAI